MTTLTLFILIKEFEKAGYREINFMINNKVVTPKAVGMRTDEERVEILPTIEFEIYEN